MLAKCANPFCQQTFRYLSRGKLIAIHRPAYARMHAHGDPQRPEYYWLCEECAQRADVSIVSGNSATAIRFVNRELVNSR